MLQVQNWWETRYVWGRCDRFPVFQRLENSNPYSPIERRSKMMCVFLCNKNGFGWKARMPNFFYRANQLCKTVYDASFDDEILETFKVNFVHFLLYT